MNRVFVVGPASVRKEGALGPRLAISRFKSIVQLLKSREERPAVIIIDRDLSRETGFGEFMTQYGLIHKIVISEEDSVKGFGPWLSDRRVYPVSRPSARELGFLVKKALNEKMLAEECSTLQGQLQGVRKELDFFDAVSSAMTSARDLDTMISGIMKKSKRLIKADSWSIFLIDEATGDLVLERTSGKTEKKGRRQKVRIKKGEGIAGWVAQEGIPIILPDVSRDKRFNSGNSHGSNLEAKSLMCVPIRAKGDILGVFEIINNTTSEAFTRDDLALFMRLVDHAAIAIELTTIHQRMAELSITDDLTKLFNTRYLNRTLEIELTRSDRHRSSLSLIFMDIDHFKVINDNYGHLVGSKLLVEIGQILIKNLRAIDIVARYGGDEFVMVLPQTPPAGALIIAERIRKSVEQHIFLKKEGYSLRMTASFGVASYPESAKSKEDLLRLADEAMYRVKNQTRNGVYAIV